MRKTAGLEQITLMKDDSASDCRQERRFNGYFRCPSHSRCVRQTRNVHLFRGRSEAIATLSRSRKTGREFVHTASFHSL